MTKMLQNVICVRALNYTDQRIMTPKSIISAVTSYMETLLKEYHFDSAAENKKWNFGWNSNITRKLAWYVHNMTAANSKWHDTQKAIIDFCVL